MNEEEKDQGNQSPGVVAYYRHSAHDRHVSSITHQQDHVRQYADEHNVQITCECHERGEPTDTSHPEES